MNYTTSIFKYLYPRDILRLIFIYRNKIKVNINKNYLQGKNIMKVIYESYIIHEYPWNNQIQRILLDNITNNVISPQKFTYIYRYDDYNDITVFNNKNLLIYILLNNSQIHIIQSEYYVLFHLIYKNNSHIMKNTKDIAQHSVPPEERVFQRKTSCVYTSSMLPSVLSTLIINRKYFTIRSQYHWLLDKLKPIGKHVKYDINIKNVDHDKFKSCKIFNEKSYIVSLEYYDHLYWYDKKKYKHISLKLPTEIKDNIEKWEQTPISLLEGHFEDYSGNIFLYRYIKYDPIKDYYYFSPPYGQQGDIKIVIPDLRYTDVCQTNYPPVKKSLL